MNKTLKSDSCQYDLRSLQLTQLKILKEFIRICDIHEFRFYIINGTCLGAVRHKGFIPWDDDIDVGMYAEDFDKFIKCADEFSEGYFLQTIETEPEFKTMIARIRLDGTTLIEKDFINSDIHQGVFIDIYPLFGYPQGSIKGQIRSWESLLYRLLLLEGPPRNHGKIIATVSSILLKLLSGNRKKKLIETIHKRLRYEKNDSEYVAFLYGMDVHLFSTIKYKRNWFLEPTMVDFEGITLPAPTDYDSYLKIRYDDYMKLPPKEKQNSYHNFEFVDLNNDYKKYKGVYYLIDTTNKTKEKD